MAVARVHELKTLNLISGNRFRGPKYPAVVLHFVTFRQDLFMM